jgi:NADP-dependent 3-hydroxy acid dehydrogenase YdfG
MTKLTKPEVVVITGASAGAGRATVREFAKRQAHIGLLARGEEGLQAARREVEQAGGKALVLPTDVADAAAVEQAAAAVEAEFGPIDIWVNNAMVTVFSPFQAIQPDEFKQVTDVTYLGCVYGTMAALRRMQPRDHGVIIQVGSALAHRSIPLQSPYCGAKHAVVGFTDALRSELINANSHVRLTIVHMPALNTPQFRWGRNHMRHKAQPVPPIFQPEVAARAIVWAAHHKRRHVLVGTPTLKAVWGQKFIPGLLDHYLAKTAYQGQQLSALEDPNRPDNLWQTVPGDRGAHGPFDGRAHHHSLALRLVQKRNGLLMVMAAGMGIALALLFANN